MVPPAILCRKHLLGEHVETHMYKGTIEKRKRLDGYVRNNLLEFKKLNSRHDALAAEMIKRGMNHKSPLDFNPENYIDIYEETILNSRVISWDALQELIRRCPECKARYRNWGRHDFKELYCKTNKEEDDETLVVKT